MDFEFPKEFDLIIVGTGVIESIISSAASRIGKRVLHIDHNDFYGGQWASFDLISIMKLKHSQEESTSNNTNSCMLTFGNNLFHIKNIEYKFHVFSEKANIKLEQENDVLKEVSERNITRRPPEDNDEAWDEELLLKSSRKFNIDLIPKLQYARGDFVELLISSNIARYSEYRSVSRILIWINGKLELLPCSRSDVFSSSKISVVEKRMLMKFLTSLNNEETERIKYGNKTFKEFLIDKKFSQNLVNYVLYGISNSSDDTPCIEGIQRAKRFLNSLGRFGKTPFLYSMYGSGEIPQAFCRLSAVFGGVFALGQPIQGFNINKNKFTSVIVKNQAIQAEKLVVGFENVPSQFVKSKKISYISRCILITNKSLVESEKEHLSLIFYPPENNKSFTTLIELGSLTGTCPNNVCLVHLTAKRTKSPKEDFEQIIKQLFTIHYCNITEKNKNKPQILWSYYFSIPDTNNLEITDDLPQNIFVCPGPDLDLDYDFSVSKAKELFNKMYPDLEFLPRAPDPEEIIIGDDNEEREQDKQSKLCNERKEENTTAIE